MSRRARRNHTPAFKAKVALAAIKGDRTIVQIAEQFDVHPNQVTSWKAQLESSAAAVFGPGGGSATTQPPIPICCAASRSSSRKCEELQNASAVAGADRHWRLHRLRRRWLCRGHMVPSHRNDAATFAVPA